MSWLTLSRTIPAAAIFTILASCALWKSYAPYKKRQRLRQTVAFIFFMSRSPPDHRAIITSFPAISKPGDSLEIILRQMSKSGEFQTKYFAMQDLRFGRMLSLPSSGLPTTPRQADLVMLNPLVEKKEQDRWECFVNFNTAFVVLSVYSTLI